MSEQVKFEAALTALQEVGAPAAFGRNRKDTEYLSTYTERCWKLWQVARTPPAAGAEGGVPEGYVLVRKPTFEMLTAAPTDGEKS